MRRSFLVPDKSAANIDDPHGIQFLIRKSLPSEPPAFASKGQVTSKTNVDKSLQPPTCIAGIGVSIVIDPPAHRFINLGYKFIRCNWCSPLGKVFNPVTNAALRRFAGKNVDYILTRVGTATLYKGKPDKIKTLGQLRNTRLFSIELQSHSPGNGLERLKRWIGTFAANQNGIIGIAVKTGSKLLRVAALI
jgi:hypothetical protein